MQNKSVNQAVRLIQYFAAVFIAIILAAILLPFLLIFCFLGLLMVLAYSLKKRYFQRKPPVKPKGTIEILMPDEPLQPTEPPFKATTDADLEITIETLQKSSKKPSAGTGIEKDKEP